MPESVVRVRVRVRDKNHDRVSRKGQRERLGEDEGCEDEPRDSLWAHCELLEPFVDPTHHADPPCF